MIIVLPCWKRGFLFKVLKVDALCKASHSSRLRIKVSDTQVCLVIFKLDFLLTPHAFWMFCRLAANSQISDVSASHWYFSSSSKRLQRIHDFNKMENISLFLQMSLDCLNMWPVCWLWYQPEYLQNGTPEMNDLILFPACSLYVHFVLSLTLKARRNSCLFFFLQVWSFLLEYFQLVCLFNYLVSTEISQQLMDGLTLYFVQTFVVHRGRIPVTLGIL